MGPVASSAARSGIATITAYILFVGASIMLMYDSPLDYRLHALQRSFSDIPILATVVIGWLALFSWLSLDRRKPHRSPRGRLTSVSWAVVSTVLIAAAIVALYECVGAAFGGGFPTTRGWPWRYWLRLFEAALFASAVVRIALPHLPRFDRMVPRFG